MNAGNVGCSRSCKVQMSQRRKEQCRAASCQLRLFYSVVERKAFIVRKLFVAWWKSNNLSASVGLKLCHIHPQSVKLSEVDLRIAFRCCCDISTPVLQQTTSRSAAWHAQTGMLVLGLITQLLGLPPGAAPPFTSFTVGPNVPKQPTASISVLSAPPVPVFAGCDPAER